MSPPRRPVRWLPLAATSAGLLAWGNLVVPALPTATVVRLAANVGATAVLVAGARLAGVTAGELGLARPTWRRGARWGAAALAVATAGYLVLLALPGGRVLLAPGADGQGAGAVALRVLLFIPLGTVLCEEVAFRGVLLAVARRQLPVGAAGACTAVVFGVWHVGTALGTVPPGRAPAAVAGTVLATGLGGGVLAWLRVRSGSLLAPVGLHLGTNSVGLLAATAASRWG